jgi:hypothetical protein
VQEEAGETVEIAYVDKSYTGENAADAPGEHGIKLEDVKLPTAREYLSSYRDDGGGAKFRLDVTLSPPGAGP